jgi:glycosyltransferase involved in cell wall biosynthesis
VAKSKNDLDISVLIATYNRVDILRQTLDSMIGLERDGLSVEFVVVDNNSSDHTKEVIESFIDRLPIRYLFEPRPGKNCALNKALNEVKLGELIVFTDDDVEPKNDWLKAIASVTERWPDYSVFGGEIYAIPPNDKVPKWVGDPSIPMCNLGAHDYAETECLYKRCRYPFGGNLWVRREVLADGRRFDESIGPRAKGRVMGSETSFLKQLVDDGFSIVYSPEALVGHRIQPEQISVWYIVKRAYWHGRGIARMDLPVCRQELLRRHPLVWRLIRIGAIVQLSLKLGGSIITTIVNKELQKVIDLGLRIGINVEWVRIATEAKPGRASGSDTVE